MKERNPVAVWIGLPLITLGIYFYVWYYKIHKEMAMFDRRRVVPVAGPMLVTTPDVVSRLAGHPGLDLPLQHR